LKLTIGSYSKAHATAHRSKEKATIGLCWSEFFLFSF